MQASALSLETHGAQLLPGLASPLLGSLGAIVDRLPSDKPGSRISRDPTVAGLLRPDGVIAKALAALAGERRRPVRAVLFDKNDRANWSLAWHQDRTIAVRQRDDLEGFGPWTVKQGILHVEPPFAVIDRMVTARIHLDPVDSSNAPLLVALGSHRLGRIVEDEIAAAVAQSDAFACLAEPGDVWIYATAILHASHAAAPGRRRRVLQVDFSADALPPGLDWLGV